MRTKALMAFDLLEQELEVLDRVAQSEILGGEYEWWVMGNDIYYKEQGSDTWNYWQNLNEVNIYASGNGYGSSGDGFNNGYSSCGYPDAPGASGSFVTWYNDPYRWNGSEGGGFGGPSSSAGVYNWVASGNKYCYTCNGGTLAEVTITPNVYTANDVIGLMLNSFGMAADHADVASAILKLESKGFMFASRSFGAVSVVTNAMDAYNEKSWEDLGQAALGAALFIPGLNGGVVIIGGAVLFAWELNEFLREH